MVSAVEGIEAQTEAVWDLAAELGLPRLVFINKLDRERASFDRTLTALQERFGAGIAPLELPVGEEAGFRGIADLLTDTAIIYENGTPPSGPIPDDLAAVEHEVREQLVEGIVVGDDDLMERYLEGEALSGAELETTLASGVAQGLVFPVVCGSAVTGVGIDRLATLLAEIAPAPDSRPPVEVQAGDSVTEVACDPAGQPLAQVFKTISDPYVGKISLLRVLSGTIQPDTVLIDPRTHADQRLHVLQLLRGKEAQPVDEAQAGDIVAVPKLSDTATGDTLAPKGTPVVVPGRGARARGAVGRHPAQVQGRRGQAHDRAAPPAGGGPRPRGRARRRDPPDHPAGHRRDPSGRGGRAPGPQVRRRGRRPRTSWSPFRETITQQAEAEGKYKKQTGGHGQYGVASIRIEPLERGEGFHFVDQVVGGAIPKQYIPAVEKGVLEAMSQGGRARLPRRRRPGDVLRRQVPLRRLVGDELQDGRRTGVPRGHGQGGAGPARAGVACSR